MVNRRSALKIGAATLAGALVNMPGLAKNTVPKPAALQCVVFDPRFAECRTFAAELGVPAAPLDGDVAELWYGDLREKLRTNRTPVAGMTDRVDLFCLEELARDVGRRVVFREDRVINNATESGFGPEMAELVRGYDNNNPRDTSAAKRTGPFSPANSTTLVAWILA